MKLVVLAQLSQTTLIYDLQASRYYVVERSTSVPPLPIEDNEVVFGAMHSDVGKCHVDLLMKVSVKSRGTSEPLNVNTAPQVEIFDVFKQMYETCKEEVDYLFAVKAGTVSVH